jgi:subtilisin family serine protease
MSVLDPSLRALLARERERAPAHVAGGLADVEISISFTGDIADLHHVGFRAPSVIGGGGLTIAAGSIPLNRLEQLAAIGHVISVEGARPIHAELNFSLPAIDAGPTKFPANQFKGRNVVVGIIDVGVDYRHGVFRKPDNTTRILALWDQSIQPKPELGEKSPDGFNHGVEYLPDKINEALRAADNDFESALEIVRSVDRVGHGTGIAGIAAGDGSQAGTSDDRGNCEPAFTFVGVAPEAALIVVKFIRKPADSMGTERPDLIQAFDYIFKHPAVLDRTTGKPRPVVVNFSHGDHLGAHDGTSNFEKAIEQLVTEKSGRVVVKSAGNDGATKRHAQGTVAAGSSTEVLTFEVQPNDHTATQIEVWYPGSSSLDVMLLPAVATVTPNRIVQPGEPPFKLEIGDPADPARARITSDTNSPANGDKRINILIDAPSGADQTPLPSGPWRIQLTNGGGPAVPFHAWINGEGNAPFFTGSHVSVSGTLSIPGTSKGVITVGAYVHRGASSGKVADFSSRGPARNAAPNEHKPDLVAPGRNVVSARANKDSRCSDCCVNFYDSEKEGQGTSVAAPHVAGAVALMFEKNPNLTFAEVLSPLQNSARRPPGFTGPLPDNDFGFGVLNVSEALKLVHPASGGGGGGGGGGPAPAIDRAPRMRTRTPIARSDYDDHAPQQFSTLPAFTALRGHAMTTPTGQLYAALISRYFSEIRGLIRSNRRVGAVWQRVGGPSLVRQLMQRVFDPDRPLPRTIKDASLASAVGRFLQVLHRYGSPDLCRDIERFGGMMTTLEGRSLNGLLGRQP